MTAVCGVCAINIIIIMENVEDTAERIIKKFFYESFIIQQWRVGGIHGVYAKEINIPYEPTTNEKSNMVILCMHSLMPLE